MSRFVGCGLAAVALVGAFVPVPSAQALTLAPAVSSVTCGAISGNIVDPTECKTAYDQATVSLGPAPTLSALGDYPGSLARVPAGANAQLTYSFAVVGGQIGDRVHLDIAALLHWATVGSPDAYAFSRVIVTTNLGEVTANICTISCGPGSGVADFNGALHVDAISGAPNNTVEMDIVASPAFSQNANSASAFADPRISINPLTPDAGAYSLLFSDGVGNAVGQPGAVPEPSSWMLMLGGIGLAGWQLRRRTSPSSSLPGV